MVTVFRVNDVLVRSWIVRERLTRSSRDRLVSVVYVQSFLGFRIDHPKDLLDVRRHLLEPCFAFAMLTQCPNQELCSKQRYGDETCRNRHYQHGRKFLTSKFGANHNKKEGRGDCRENY